MPDYAIYDVTIRTVSPLHVGSGETLLNGYDYGLYDGRTWRLNLNVLLEEKVQDEAMARRAAQIPPGQLLSPADYREGSPIFRYVLDGQPRATSAGAEVGEQIKDAWDRPYLPGSSLKGAIRTALLWNAVRESGQAVTLDSLGNSNRFAAQRLETHFLHQVGQRQANYDLFRALQVGDSQPLDSSALVLANAQVIGGRSQTGAPIELEAIRPNTRLRTRIKIDEALLSDWARRHGLDLSAQRGLLEDIPALIRRHSRVLAQRGLAWCEGNVEREKLLEFYANIESFGREDSCYIQIGWGGGWDSKTLGNLLQRDPVAFEEIAQKYRLRRLRRGARVRPGTRFPSTRRMTVRVTQDARGATSTRIGGPLGWLVLTFRRRA